MTEVELRKFQEAVANLLLIKGEFAKSLFELYKAYQQAGFTKNEALELVKTTFKT